MVNQQYDMTTNLQNMEPLGSFVVLGGWVVWSFGYPTGGGGDLLAMPAIFLGEVALVREIEED